MRGGNGCSRLCRLINHHLRRYTVVSSLTKEKEKDLLISLSQVSKEIQLWIDEIESDSSDEHDKSVSCCSVPSSDENHCLLRILANLIGLLSVQSPYIQHITGNILAKISEFLAACGSDWDVYICLLCDYMGLAVIDVLPRSSASSVTGLSISYAVPKPKLENANWFAVAGAFRVLRIILKHLSREEDDELLTIFLKSLSSTLASIPWCLLDEICFYQHGNGKNNSQADTSATGNLAGCEPRIIFLGNFVQCLCSLVQQSRFLEDSGSSGTTHPILLTIINLVPNLLLWSLPKQQSRKDACISQYFKHKLLVLMMRLSYQSDLDCTTLASCLQLLHLYFQDLLQQPLDKPEPIQDDCLEGSPFLLNIDGEVHDTSSNHLQRLVIFLFLRYTFSLISLRTTNNRCLCPTRNSCMASDSISTECHGRKKGLQDLFEWIDRHLPGYTFADREIYIEKFSSSFLQLYIHEDDLLFKVLLQLLSAPFYGVEGFNKEKLLPLDEEQVIVFHVSTLFSPVYLFHTFLSQLQYDHEVLLDYLISRDIGTSCAEYLLRCLRIVCDSWNLFMEFPLGKKALHMSSSKKRKIPPDGSNFEVKVSSAPPASTRTQPKSSNQHSCRLHGTRRLTFEDAKNCLLSLKSSIENLHQKNLFPYNPEVLLKRLTRFQELCFNQ